MFNISAQLHFQAHTGSLRQTQAQIQSAIGGIRAKVDLDIAPRAQAHVRQLGENLALLRANIQALNAAAAPAAAGVARVGAAMAGVAAQSQAAAAGMRAATTAARQTSAAAAEGAGSMNEFGKQVGLAARRFAAFTVATGAFFAVTQAIREGVGEAVQFDLQMNRLQQVSLGAAGEVGKVGDDVMRLSTKLGVASGELAETAVTFRQAGLSLREVKVAMDVAAKASLAPNFRDIKQTTEGMVATYQQFGRQVGNLADQMGAVNAIAGDFAVEAGDLVSAIQKTGGAASQAGTQFNELLALFTSIRATTRESADSIGTGLRTIFTRLQRPEAVDSLRQLGIHLRHTREEAAALGKVDLENQFVGGFEAVRRLSEGLAKIRPTDARYAAAVETLGGYRQVSRVIPLLQQFGEAQKALNVARLGSASLEAAAATRQVALATKFAKTREEFQKFANELVQSKNFKSTVDGLVTMADALAQVLNFLKPTLPLLMTLGTVRLASGIFQFGAGVYQGAVSNLGGRAPVRKFATGGVVPGFGSGDTAPADLEPGEFVIRKASAQKVGYAALHALNDGRQRFAAGGPAGRNTVPALLTPGEFVFGRDAAARLGPHALRRLNEHGDLPRFANGGPVLRFGAGGVTPDVHAAIQRVLAGLPFRSDDARQEAAVRLLTRASTGGLPADPAELERFLAQEARRGGKAYEAREARHKKKFVTGATNAAGNPVVDSVAAREAVSNAHPFDPKVRAKAGEFSKQGLYASTLGKARTEELVRLGVERGELTAAEASAILGRPFVAKPPSATVAGPASLAAAPAATTAPAPATSTALVPLPPITALARTNPAGLTRVPGSGPAGARGPAPDYVDAEYRVVGGPPAALPGGGSQRALPPGPPAPKALPPHVAPATYGFAPPDPIPAGSPLTALPKNDRYLAGAKGVVKGDAVPLAPPMRPTYGLAPPAAGDRLPLAPDPARTAAVYGSRPIPTSREEEAARLAALRARNEGRNRLLDAGLAPGGTLTEEADARFRRNVAVAGGPNKLSQQTMTEMAERAHAQALEELTKGIRRQVQALNPGIKAAEAERIAREQAERALKENAAVLRNSRGQVVGTAALGAELSAQGKDAAGRTRLGAWMEKTGAVGRGVAALGRSFTPQGGMMGAYGAIMAAPMVGQFFDPSKDAIANAAATGNASGVKSGAAASGLLSGAAMGAGVGMMFGPWGPAIGAVVGGLGGLVSSLRQAEKDIREAKVGQSLGKLGDALQGAATGVNGTGGMDASSVTASVGDIRKEVDAKVQSATNPTFGTVSAADAAAIRGREVRAAFGGQAGLMVGVLSRRSEELAKANPGARPEDLARKLTADKGTSSLLDVVADVRGVGVGQVVKEFTESIRVAQRQVAAQREVDRGRVAAENAAVALARLTDAVTNAANSTARFDTSMSVLGSIFSGQGGTGRVTSVSGGFASLGTGTGAEFRQAAGVVGAAVGPVGNSFLRSAAAADDLTRALPGVLEALAASPLGPDEAVGPKARALLEERLLPGMSAEQRSAALKDNPALDAAIRSASGSITAAANDKDGGGLAGRLKDNADKLADEVAAAFTGPLKEAGQRMAQAVEDHANKYSDGLAAARSMLNTIGESRDRGADLALGRRRVLADTAADRTGVRAADLLSLRDLQAPFQGRQERLTGLAGDAASDPAAVAARLKAVTAELPRAVAARDAALGGKDGFAAAAGNLDRLTGQANNLQQALKNLTDVSTRAAGIQEKLNAATLNRDGRLGYAEKYAMASGEQRARMQRGQAILTRLDRGQAGLGQLSDDERRLALETLNDFGQVRLASGRTGEGLKRQLLGNLPGVLDPRQEAERQGLQGELGRAAGTAEAANQALADHQRDLHTRFLADLRGLHDQFFARLATNLAAEMAASARSNLTAATADRAALAKDEKSRALLARVGVTDQSGLTSLRGSEGALREFFSAQDKIRAASAGPVLAQSGEAGVAADATTIVAEARTNKTDKLRAVLTGHGLEKLSGEQQAQALENIKSDIYYTGMDRPDELNASIRRHLTTGRASTLASLQDEQADSRNKLSRQRVNVQALAGMGEGDRTSLLEAVGNTGLNLATLDQRIRDADASLSRFRAGVDAADATLRKTAGAEATVAGPRAAGYAGGGNVFKPMGTDTVPAMLTPGEFVVNRASAQANLALLKRVNDARGPLYLAGGGLAEMNDGLRRALMAAQAPAGPDPRRLLAANRGMNAANMASQQALYRGLGGVAGADGQAFAGVAALAHRRADANRLFLDLFGTATYGARLGELGSVRAAGAAARRRVPTTPAGARPVRPEPYRPYAVTPAGGGTTYGSPASYMSQFAARTPSDKTDRKFVPGTREYDDYKRSLFGGVPRLRNGPGGPRYYAAGGLVANLWDWLVPSPVDAVADVARAAQSVRRMAAPARPERPRPGEVTGATPYPQVEPKRYAAGGVVGGSGTGDTVPALLTPGEYVFSRPAVEALGARRLDKVHRYARGGLVGGAQYLAGGGGVAAGPGPSGLLGLSPEAQQAMAGFAERSKELAGCLQTFGTHTTTFADGVNKFGAYVDRLVSAIEKMPTEVHCTMRGDMNVHHNGADVMNHLGGEVDQRMASYFAGEVKKAMGAWFPDAVGPLRADRVRVL